MENALHTTMFNYDNVFRTSLHKLWWHRISYAYTSVSLCSLACLTGRDRFQQRILTNSFQDTSWEISNNTIYHLIGKFFLRLREGKVLSYKLPTTKKDPCTRFLAVSVTAGLITSAPFLTARFLADWLITWTLAAITPRPIPPFVSRKRRPPIQHSALRFTILCH